MKKHLIGAVIATMSACTLVACGGGGGSEPSGTPPLTTSVPVSGVAAMGAAIAGGTVDVKCAGGNTASTTTSSSGGYSVTVAAAALPCVVRVTINGATLHSVIETGVALPAVANVTPLTELLTAQLAGATASSFFNTFDAAAQARLTPAAVTTATTNVATALAGVINIAGDDLLRGGLTPAVDGSGGNLADQKLDALARALRDAGSSVAAVAQALVSSPGTPPPVLASVPLATVSCPALRGGRYFNVFASEPLAAGAVTVLNAQTLIGTAESPSTRSAITFTAASGQPCRFTAVDGAGTTQELLVAKSGIAVSRSVAAGTPRLSVLLPAQTIAVADLAGTWNYVSYVRAGGVLRPENGTYTVAASGAVSANQSFLGLTSNGPGSTGFAFVAHPGGGFGVTLNGTADAGRYFAFRAPDGSLTLIGNPEGQGESLEVARRQENVAPRAVGALINFWDVTVSATTVDPIVEYLYTIVANNLSSTPTTETRIRASDNRVDTRTFNNPRQGLRYRATNACTAGVNGPAVNCAGSITIDAQGTGFGAGVGLTNNSYFELFVTKP